MRTAASVRWNVSQQYSGRGKLMKELNHVTHSKRIYPYDNVVTINFLAAFPYTASSNIKFNFGESSRSVCLLLTRYVARYQAATVKLVRPTAITTKTHMYPETTALPSV